MRTATDRQLPASSVPNKSCINRYRSRRNEDETSTRKFMRRRLLLMNAIIRDTHACAVLCVRTAIDHTHGTRKKKHSSIFIDTHHVHTAHIALHFSARQTRSHSSQPESILMKEQFARTTTANDGRMQVLVDCTRRGFLPLKCTHFHWVFNDMVHHSLQARL